MPPSCAPFHYTRRTLALPSVTTQQAGGCPYVNAIWVSVRSLVAALMAAVHLVLPAHHGQPVPTTAPIPRVEVFGDSVSWESESYISDALRHRAVVNYH